MTKFEQYLEQKVWSAGYWKATKEAKASGVLDSDELIRATDALLAAMNTKGETTREIIVCSSPVCRLCVRFADDCWTFDVDLQDDLGDFKGVQELTDETTITEWLKAGAVFIWPAEAPSWGAMRRDDQKRRIHSPGEKAIVARWLLGKLIGELKLSGWKQYQVHRSRGNYYFLMAF